MKQASWVDDYAALRMVDQLVRDGYLFCLVNDEDGWWAASFLKDDIEYFARMRSRADAIRLAAQETKGGQHETSQDA